MDVNGHNARHLDDLPGILSRGYRCLRRCRIGTYQTAWPQ